MRALNDARSSRNAYGSEGMNAAPFFARQSASVCCYGSSVGFLVQFHNGFGCELLHGERGDASVECGHLFWVGEIPEFEVPNEFCSDSELYIGVVSLDMCKEGV